MRLDSPTAQQHPEAMLIAAGGAGGSTSYAALQGADAAWANAKAQKVLLVYVLHSISARKAVETTLNIQFQADTGQFRC